MIAIRAPLGKLAGGRSSPYPPDVPIGSPQLRALTRLAATASTRYRMIDDGDRILVALSGGKDSATLLYLLRRLQSRAPVRFELAAVTVDGGWGGHPTELLRRYCDALEVPLILRLADIVGTVLEKVAEDETPCPLCARLRRGAIYSAARELGFGTVALGHHADDLVETLLLNQLFNAQIKAMPPVLAAEDGVTRVIRPLLLADESAIRSFARSAGLPSVPCQCLGSGKRDLRRPQIKQLVEELEQRFPGARRNLVGSTTRLREVYLADERWLPLGEPPRGPFPGQRPPAPPAPDEMRRLLRS